MKQRIWMIAACVPLLVATPLQAEWTGAWRAPAQGIMGSDRPKMPTIDHVMIQQILRVAAGGPRLRIRISNEAAITPLTLGLIRIVRIDDNGVLEVKSLRAAKLIGLVDGAIPARAAVMSEPVDIAVKPLDRILVSIQVPGLVERPTVHRAARADTVISLLPGATPHPERVPAPTAADAAPPKPQPPINPTEGAPVKHGMRYFVDAVDVDTPAPVKTVVAIGDSITDGVNASLNADRRWPDVLAGRIVAAKLPLAVVNAGISGNRVLKGGTGTPLIARFDRDALQVPGVGYILLLEGVNDIGSAEREGGTPSSAAIIDAYKQLIAKAHAKSVKVIGATITPYKGSKNWTEAGEQARGEINAWIRTPGNFDGFADFDAAVRDPSNQQQMPRANHGGDSLHPNDTGLRLMGNAIDLALFR